MKCERDDESNGMSSESIRYRERMEEMQSYNMNIQ